MTRKKDKESKEAFTIWSRLEKILKDKKIENYTVTSNTPGSVVPEFLYYAIIKNVDDNIIEQLIQPKNNAKPRVSKTPSTRKDESRYVVYLFDHFDKKVYLTFNQGTEDRKLEKIERESKDLRAMLKPYFIDNPSIKWESLSGGEYSEDEEHGEKYSKATVCYIR